MTGITRRAFWPFESPSEGRVQAASAGLVVVLALLGCKLPSPDTNRPSDESTAQEDEATNSKTPDGILDQASRIDARVGAGSMRTAECHNENGMGSMVVAHELEGRIVKIVRRTELAPPTISTAYYFDGDTLILVRTRLSDLIEGDPPEADLRFYRSGKLVRRLGKPADDSEPDAKRASEDLAVARALMAGMRERTADIRLPPGAW